MFVLRDIIIQEMGGTAKYFSGGVSELPPLDLSIDTKRYSIMISASLLASPICPHKLAIW